MPQREAVTEHPERSTRRCLDCPAVARRRAVPDGRPARSRPGAARLGHDLRKTPAPSQSRAWNAAPPGPRRRRPAPGICPIRPPAQPRPQIRGRDGSAQHRLWQCPRHGGIPSPRHSSAVASLPSPMKVGRGSARTEVLLCSFDSWAARSVAASCRFRARGPVAGSQVVTPTGARTSRSTRPGDRHGLGGGPRHCAAPAGSSRGWLARPSTVQHPLRQRTAVACLTC